MPATQEETLEEYLDNRISTEESGCWIWFRPNPGRYPSGCYRGKQFPVGKYLWEKENGAVPSGLLLRHTCDRTEYVNPAHLVPGTHKDNKRDFMERHPRATEICAEAARRAREGSRRRWDRLSPEEREEFIKHRSAKQASLATEESRENQRKATVAANRRRWARLSPEQRSEDARERWSRKSKEERSSIAARTWKTRRERGK